MANTSGQAGRGVPAESFANAAFTHAESGFRYRVSRGGGAYWMDFEKAADGGIQGRKPLSYFVGSGAVARSYLMVADGFLYEAPVTYYSGGAKWDLSPNYDRYAYPFLTRAIVPGCLNCHASSLSVMPEPEPFRQPAVPGRRRKLRALPRGGRSAHPRPGRGIDGQPGEAGARKAGQRLRAVPSLGRSARDACGRLLGFLSSGRPPRRFDDGVRARRCQSGDASDQSLRETGPERL